MRYFFILLLLLLMIALVLYLQIRPYRDQLDEKHAKYFGNADRLFGPLLRLTGGWAKPYKIGPNTEVDLGPAILMAILALLALLSLVR
ncbi:MAG: hypothetical protein AAGN35_08115 [Bacteroidota bacterium]